MTIDTEEEWDWGGGWPVGSPSVSNVEGLPRFQALCARYGIATTYFANFAVLNDVRTAKTLRELARQPAVEVGLHIHPWNTPPLQATTTVTSRQTFLHNLPPEVQEAKLTTVLEAFQANDLTPRSFRGGRYSVDDHMQGFLRDGGFVVDASVVPFTTWPEDGAPDYRTRGLEPQRRAPRRGGESALWEIPLTLAFTRRPHMMWRRCYEVVEGSALSKLRLIGIAERLGLVRRVGSGADPAGAAPGPGRAATPVRVPPPHGSAK